MQNLIHYYKFSLHHKVENSILNKTATLIFCIISSFSFGLDNLNSYAVVQPRMLSLDACEYEAT